MVESILNSQFKAIVFNFLAKFQIEHLWLHKVFELC